MQLQSGDAGLFYEIHGPAGAPALVLLHPFPTNHHFWKHIAPQLASRWRLLIPDLRCHGASQCGNSAPTMAAHAKDLDLLCEANQIASAIFFGVSIGGYILFEFWRRYSQRVRALILCDTRAQADTPEGRATRLQSAADVERNGSARYLEGMLPKLLGASTHREHPEVVTEAHGWMQQMKPAAIAAVLRGMAARPDSTATLPAINVPTLIIVGAEDTLTPPADAKLMQKNIRGSELVEIPKAGHYAPLEQPRAVLQAVSPFLAKISGSKP